MKPASTILTYGQKAVGITFNPGGMTEVSAIKAACAKAIDVIYDAEVKPTGAMRNGERVAQAIIAIRRIQEGQMWGVKAVTWQY